MNEPLAIKLRPTKLEEVIGQKHLIGKNKILTNLLQNKKLFSMILYGNPGIGKTTIAHAIVSELNVKYRTFNAVINTKKDFDIIIEEAKLYQGMVLILDEIHRLNPAIEEVLYSAMEDFQLDLIIGEGPSARSVRIDLQPFTLVGATTRSGLLSTPLRERFGIPLRLDFYSHEDLKKIVQRNAKLLNIEISDDGAMEIAKRSRGTPRIAGRLLRRVRDFGAVSAKKIIDSHISDTALKRLDVDDFGLDAFDRRYLNCIIKNYGGGPVGADTLAAALSEERDTIEEVVEPFLLKLGFLQRTPRGRIISQLGYRYLGVNMPTKQIKQYELLETLKD